MVRCFCVWNLDLASQEFQIVKKITVIITNFRCCRSMCSMWNISIWWLWTRRNCIGRRIKLHNNVIRTTVPALLPRLILIIWNTSLGVFSVLLVLKVEGVFPDSTSWFLVFAPLFSSDGINAYFCIIVFIRQYLYQEFSNAPLRTLWSLLVIGS